MLLSICLIFGNFQPGVVYKSAAYKKKACNCFNIFTQEADEPQHLKILTTSKYKAWILKEATLTIHDFIHIKVASLAYTLFKYIGSV